MTNIFWNCNRFRNFIRENIRVPIEFPARPRLLLKFACENATPGNFLHALLDSAQLHAENISALKDPYNLETLQLISESSVS